MIYIGIVAGIFLLELFLKNHIETHRDVHTEETICKNMLIVRKYHNKGAFLDMGERVRPLVATVSLLLTAAVTVVFVLTLGQKGRGVLKAGLALLLGGAFSNTYDRLRRKYVVDYFSFNVKWKKLRSVVFNLSDFCILIGALMAALQDK